MTSKNDELVRIAKTIRRDIIEMAYRAGGAAHPGPALSCADIVTALYFKIMNVRPDEPDWADRDRLILSKGHASPAIYAALAEKGYFDKELFHTLRFPGSKLQGHPDMRKTPGVDMTAGSLGHGLSAGLGVSLALKIRKSPARVYVILGDGELDEGIVWEAAMSAPNLGADNLTAIVDYNHFQSGGCTDKIQCLEPLVDKWKAFGWRVYEANGHNMDDIVNKLEMAKMSICTPTVIIAHTIKGKGASFMENNNAWHQKMPTEAQYLQALKELE
ncbi:MAG: transketolase [Clostridia bacterium]|nr:transketolase [Clostridia bacterium]